MYYDSKYSFTYNQNISNENLQDKENEIITKKIPSIKVGELYTQSNNSQYIHIAILKCKINYQELYSTNNHAIIIKTENNDAWFGIPIKASYAGTIEWSKIIWEIITEFDLSLDSSLLIYQNIE